MKNDYCKMLEAGIAPVEPMEFQTDYMNAMYVLYISNYEGHTEIRRNSGDIDPILSITNQEMLVINEGDRDAKVWLKGLLVEKGIHFVEFIK